MTLSWPHIHLLLNHFPIVGAIFGLLLLVYAMVRDSKELKQASYWVFILVALLTIPTYIAGREAAHIVTDLPNVSEAFVHKHRNIAEWAFIALEITGAFGIVGLILSRKPRKTPAWLTITLLTFVIVSTGLVSWAGLQGGIIRHTEVRGDLPFLMPDETESGSHGGSEESGHSH